VFQVCSYRDEKIVAESKLVPAGLHDFWNILISVWDKKS